MYAASDLKKNLRIKIDNEPYILTEFNFLSNRVKGRPFTDAN